MDGYLGKRIRLGGCLNKVETIDDIPDNICKHLMFDDWRRKIIMWNCEAPGVIERDFKCSHEGDASVWCPLGAHQVKQQMEEG